MRALTDKSSLDDLMALTAQQHGMRGRVVGYGHLWRHFDVAAPLRSLEVLSEARISKNERMVDGVLWRSVKWSGETVFDHLEYAVRRESLDLLLLKRIFENIEGQDLVDLTEAIRSRPTAANARRVWFFYEWLTGKTLDIPDAKVGNYEVVLDPEVYCARSKEASVVSRRHRVIDNLPGTAQFCAITRRSALVDLASDYGTRIRQTIAEHDPALMRRAVAHIVLKDSRASFEIEGEVTSTRGVDERVRRWAKTLSAAGRRPLDMDYILALQEDVIGNNPMIKKGLRTAGVFLGDHDRDGMPVPEFIGARPEDVSDLVQGILGANGSMIEDPGFNPLAHSAAVGFGFVYAHPLEDGNGRIHRYLLQHVLAERKVSPSGVIFPVSSVIAGRIEDYADVLKRHSQPLMDFIPWRATQNGNVEVLEDTSDLYRYPDVTEQAQFVAECINRTIEFEMPDEIRYLRGFDYAKAAIRDIAEMSDMKAGLLIALIRQNDGSLSKKKRKAEYGELPDEALSAIEHAVRESFGMEAPAVSDDRRPD